jgi:3-methylcrotonyl-CoA carboxylase beta subunit
VDKDTDDFTENQKYYAKRREYFEAVTKLAGQGGGPRLTEQHRKRGRLLADEKLKLLLDDDKDYLEVLTLMGLGTEEGHRARAATITGIGKVSGIYCNITIHDSTVQGAAMSGLSIAKYNRFLESTTKLGLPAIFVVDSGGAHLSQQDNLYADKGHGGSIFYNEAIASSLGLPLLAVVCGPTTAGSAYIPSMCSENSLVHKVGSFYLGGPPLVYAALGEEVTEEELGGATLHCKYSGCSDTFAPTEAEGMELARESVRSFNLKGPQKNDNYLEPLYDAKDLEVLIPRENIHTLDPMQVIARITDGSDFQEFKELYGTGLVTGFAKIHGYLVGIVANRGPVCGDSATKGSHFVQLCDQRNVPLVFLQNTWPLEDYVSLDQGYAMKCHGQMMASISCATVPKVTIKMGNDTDDTAHLMGGKGLDVNFVFSWPCVNSFKVDKTKIEKEIVQRKFPKGADVTSPEYKKYMTKMESVIEHRASNIFGSSIAMDDGVILAEDTRKTLGLLFEIMSQPPADKQIEHNVLRM